MEMNSFEGFISIFNQLNALSSTLPPPPEADTADHASTQYPATSTPASAKASAGARPAPVSRTKFLLLTYT